MKPRRILRRLVLGLALRGRVRWVHSLPLMNQGAGSVDLADDAHPLWRQCARLAGELTQVARSIQHQRQRPASSKAPSVPSIGPPG